MRASVIPPFEAAHGLTPLPPARDARIVLCARYGANAHRHARACIVLHGCGLEATKERSCRGRHFARARRRPADLPAHVRRGRGRCLAGTGVRTRGSSLRRGRFESGGKRVPPRRERFIDRRRESRDGIENAPRIVSSASSWLPSAMRLASQFRSSMQSPRSCSESRPILSNKNSVGVDR